MNRAERRARERALKKAGKKGTDMEKKLGLFDKIPENCLTCLKEFDKLNKEMVMSWNVIVREEEGVVRLYCPDCWNKATEFAKEMRDLGDKND
jgi:predicted RNA-binding Zn-ribbon protein involved in translation (DUF1610 family)